LITSEFHVSLGGVNYRLAEDAEGEHYVRTKEPLRAPNAQIVQGEQAAKYNIRPDVLLWTWTNWSGGEGQLKFNPEDPNRSLILEGVNWNTRPGVLTKGYQPDRVQNSAGGAFTVRSGLTHAGPSNLMYAVGVGTGQDDRYPWNTASPWKWQAGVSFGTTDGAWNEQAVAGDNNYIYYVKTGTASVYRATPASGTATHLNDQAENVECQLAELGDYLYKFNKNGKVFELSKTTVNTTTAETAVFDFSSNGTIWITNFYGRKIVAGDNRIYVMAVYGARTIIYEIVPSAASGTGFGRELARIDGQKGESMWWHGGFLWWSAVTYQPDGTDGPSRGIYYLQPGGAWGTIGEVRSVEIGEAIAGKRMIGGAATLHTSAFALPGTWSGRTADQARMSLFEIDAITGGFGQTGFGYDIFTEEMQALDIAYHDGVYVVAQVDKAAGTSYTQAMWTTNAYDDTNENSAVSPAFDFDIASEKVLHSIEVECDPLPAAAIIDVAYSLDGAAWVPLAAITLDGSTGVSFQISTAASTKTFRSMQLRLELHGNSTASPVIRAINVRAGVEQHLNTWQMILDCSDESSPRGHTGATLMSNLRQLAESTVFELLDGYENRQLDWYWTYDVVIDSMSFVQDRPGEGIVQVVLREVA
jgi:hypothetical protein